VIDRLLLISSLLLVVLTVVFAQFMDAEKFWRDKAITVELRLLEKPIEEGLRKELERSSPNLSGIKANRSSTTGYLRGSWVLLSFSPRSAFRYTDERI
jgi:hypothetical protein